MEKESRYLLLSLLLLIALPAVNAADLSVSVNPIDNIIFVENENHATLDIRITNNDITDNFQIYSLVGVDLTPRHLGTIISGNTIRVDLEAFPQEKTFKDIRGFFKFEYQIKGDNAGFYTDFLTIKIIEVTDALDLKLDNIDPTDETIGLTIKNKEPEKIEDITLSASSDFFDFSETLSLDKNEEKIINIPIKKENIESLSAGPYETDFNISYSGFDYKVTETLNYLEKDGTLSSENLEGFIIRTKTIEKINQGNVPSNIEIIERKNILTRLFTTNSPKATSIEKEGFAVNYIWRQELSPGESLVIKSTTNYTLPFVIVILIILIGLGTKLYLDSSLSVKKRVSMVRTKGGEFALKIKLTVKSRKSAKNVVITDRIPKVMKLYDKFTHRPDKIDSKKRTLEWEIKHLNAGEERTFTYVVYSKIGLIGRFELPRARATYEIEDKKKESLSNKTYSVAESGSSENN